jgi:hypothetical protein
VSDYLLQRMTQGLTTYESRPPHLFLIDAVNIARVAVDEAVVAERARIIRLVNYWVPEAVMDAIENPEATA